MKMRKGSMEGVLLRKAGQEGQILGSEEVEKELERIGLKVARHNIPGTNLVMLYHSGEVLKVGRQDYLVGSPLIFHKKENTVSELNEDEVFEAVMELVEREIKVTADGSSFLAYELK